MHEHLKEFTGVEERVLIGRAQEKTPLFLTRVHNRLLRTGMAELTDTRPDPPLLRKASNDYKTAIDQLIQHAGLAA
ncbi:hypothetical protein [Frankia tisae]|uniref:hypothetical protein n=1 Tax=Frankia tisae TaxID=2950104 RepID=UPI0021BF46EB|nr:hypothetical protein [Frankia tisae]